MSIKPLTTMSNVFNGVISYFRTQGHPYSTYKPHKTALYKMQNYLGTPMTPYSIERINQFMAEMVQQFDEGTISAKTLYTTRRTVAMANEFYETGKISLGNKHIPCTPHICVSDESALLIAKYKLMLSQKITVIALLATI